MHEVDGFGLPDVEHAGQLTYLQSTAIERARTELWFARNPQYERADSNDTDDVPEWVEDQAQ